MAKKKSEETVEETEATVESTEKAEETETAVEAAETETAEKETKKAAKPKAKKADSAEETPANETKKKAAPKSKNEDTEADKSSEKKVSKRSERVGIVASDKMMKTVTVRVERQVKHPIYRKYVKRRKNFMAHDDLGSTVGDRVRIVETRPLSARKRWRVVEIIQKAEK
ncbi:MAG: 30S ribosomal protein S17 [Pyrinomonadaceae bacterium]|nr:30S ribosomal protein S17 [Pyrinomonadaceae bacterium]